MTAPRPPQLSGQVHVAPDADRLYHDLAMTLMGVAYEAVGERDVFHLALSGGSTPEPFYVRLVTDPLFRGIPWEHTHLWIVDERRVPDDDPSSNFRMIRESLTDHVPTRSRQKHPMPVLASDPVSEYEAELREVFGTVVPGTATRDLHQHDQSVIPSLDFALLGMGDDGHTASLFPYSEALGITDRWIAINDDEQVTPPARLTMTYPLLNAASHIAVLVTGAKKSQALRRVEVQLRAGPDPHSLPITGIDPSGPDEGRQESAGELTWYLDADAAA